MHDIEMRTFNSAFDFARTFFDLFRGPTFFMTFRRMDPLLREKIILAFSSTNNCGLCMKVHTAWGMKLGLDESDVEKIVTLYKEDFPEKEWLSLNHARKFAANRGRDPKGPLIFAYGKAYSKKERADMKKILRMMKMANYSANLFLGLPFRAGLEPGRDFSRMGLVKRLPGPFKAISSMAAHALESPSPA